jgi:signal transduction histidine kinase
MIRWRPRSLIAQTIIVLMVGLTASHLLSMVVYSGDRISALTRQGDRATAMRVADAANLILRTPAADRTDLVARFAGLSLNATLHEAAPFAAPEAPNAETEAVRGDIAARLPPAAAADVQVMLQAQQDHATMTVVHHLRDALYGEPERMIVRAALPLPGGGWLQLVAPPPEEGADHSALASMAAMVAAIVVAAVWVVRRMTAPLKTLADAARRMARDVNAPDLPETGPAEVREAIAAFNTMRNEVRRLLDNRTLMLAAISHDLRTPITLLRLRVEAFAPGDDRDRMLGSLADMERMIASTLGFARQDAADEPHAVLDLAALLDAMAADMQDVGLDVAYAGPQGHVRLACRPQALKRAIANIVDNAVNYGGRAEIDLKVAADTLRLTVADYGPGLPPDELEKVFQPFYRCEASRSRSTGGSGLGLSIARDIVAAHGGTIALANRAGGGLVVTIALPRAE